MRLYSDKFYAPCTFCTLDPVYARAHFKNNGKLSGSIKVKMGPAYMFSMISPVCRQQPLPEAPVCYDNRELYLVLSQWVKKPKSPI